MEEAIGEMRNNDATIRSQLYEKERAITILTERNLLNADALASYRYRHRHF
jgi:hypothetical protein